MDNFFSNIFSLGKARNSPTPQRPPSNPNFQNVSYGSYGTPEARISQSGSASQSSLSSSSSYSLSSSQGGGSSLLNPSVQDSTKELVSKSKNFFATMMSNDNPFRTFEKQRSKSFHEIALYYLRINNGQKSVKIHTIFGPLFEEMKTELRSADYAVRFEAVKKVPLFEMIGYDCNPHMFSILEFLGKLNSNSLEDYHSKRIGYVAACFSFDPKSELMLLTTETLKQDLNSRHSGITSFALDFLGIMSDVDTAKNCFSDIQRLTTSNSAHLRKKSTAVMYNLLVQFPNALSVMWPILVKLLKDPSPSVVAVTIRVIAQISAKNPQKYLSIAPHLIQIISSYCEDPHLIISAIRLIRAFIPHEPRIIVKGKIVQILKEIISKWENRRELGAIALTNECLQTLLTFAEKLDKETAQFCVVKLRDMIQDPERNSRYFGLGGLYTLWQSHPKALSSFAPLRDVILVECLTDIDMAVKNRALQILDGIVTSSSLTPLISRLADYYEESGDLAFQTVLVEKILSLAGKNTYQNLRDFEWYISVLVKILEKTFKIDTVEDNGCEKIAQLICPVFIDISTRVPSVRYFLVGKMVEIISSQKLYRLQMVGHSLTLSTAAWILGEFYELFLENLKEPALETSFSLCKILLDMKVLKLFRAEYPAFNAAACTNNVQALFMWSCVKIFAFSAKFTANSPPEFQQARQKLMVRIVALIRDNAPPFVTSTPNIDAQERAQFLIEATELYLMNISLDNEDKSQREDRYPKTSKYVSELVSLFAERLNPTNSKAQQKMIESSPVDLSLTFEDIDFPETIYDEPTRKRKKKAVIKKKKKTGENGAQQKKKGRKPRKGKATKVQAPSQERPVGVYVDTLNEEVEDFELPQEVNDEEVEDFELPQEVNDEEPQQELAGPALASSSPHVKKKTGRVSRPKISKKSSVAKNSTFLPAAEPVARDLPRSSDSLSRKNKALSSAVPVESVEEVHLGSKRDKPRPVLAKKNSTAQFVHSELTPSFENLPKYGYMRSTQSFEQKKRSEANLRDNLDASDSPRPESQPNFGEGLEEQVAELPPNFGGEEGEEEGQVLVENVETAQRQQLESVQKKDPENIQKKDPENIQKKELENIQKKEPENIQKQDKKEPENSQKMQNKEPETPDEKKEEQKEDSVSEGQEDHLQNNFDQQDDESDHEGVPLDIQPLQENPSDED